MDTRFGICGECGTTRITRSGRCRTCQGPAYPIQGGSRAIREEIGRRLCTSLAEALTAVEAPDLGWFRMAADHIGEHLQERRQ